MDKGGYQRGFLRHNVTWTVTNPIISSINKPLANRRGALFMDLFFRNGTDDKPPTIIEANCFFGRLVLSRPRDRDGHESDY